MFKFYFDDPAHILQRQLAAVGLVRQYDPPVRLHDPLRLDICHHRQVRGQRVVTRGSLGGHCGPRALWMSSSIYWLS